MASHEHHHNEYSPGERAILRKLDRIEREIGMADTALQQHLEQKIAEDEAAVEAVGQRVSDAQAALEVAVTEANSKGIDAAPLEAALDQVKAHADAIDAAKAPEGASGASGPEGGGGGEGASGAEGASGPTP